MRAIIRALTAVRGLVIVIISAVATQLPALTHAEPRTIDMTVVLLDQNGKPIPDATKVTPEDPSCSKCPPLTLGTAVATALLADHKEEATLSSIDKAKRATLALRLLDNKTAMLTAKETADIIRLLNVWGSIVVVRVVPALDPNLDLSDK